MKKNTAGQKIGAQLITAADGTAFTGAVTVAVTGDAGTQATGSVGSGACTHEGNGYHTYAPAQAETNYDLIAFTFTGTGAIPVTVQVYTEFDSNVLTIEGSDATDQINAACDTAISDAALATAAALATVDGIVDAILLDTSELQTDWVNGGRLDLILDAILADTGELQTNQGNWLTATGFSTHSAADVRTEMDSNSTQFAKLGTPAGVSISADIAAISAGSGNAAGIRVG